MCGRFTLQKPVKELATFFGLAETPDLTARYNIAPTQPVATVVVLTGDRRFKLMRWGLIPPWAKDPSIGSRMINARAETVAEKPAFRSGFKHRRCLVMADGFYEWQTKGKAKQPFHVVKQDMSPFAFAGLWERWEPAGEGEPVESCTIITTEANALVRQFHDRMPVILDAEAFDLWLDPAVTDPERLLPLLRPYPAEKMEAYPVSGLVNSPGHESAECILPLMVPARPGQLQASGRPKGESREVTANRAHPVSETGAGQRTGSGRRHAQKYRRRGASRS